MKFNSMSDLMDLIMYGLGVLHFCPNCKARSGIIATEIDQQKVIKCKCCSVRYVAKIGKAKIKRK